MSILLVDVERVRRHLRETTSDEIDMDIEDLIAEAQEIVVDYLKIDLLGGQPSPITQWSGPLLAATLLIIGELYMNREASVADILTPAIENLLRRARTPAMA